MCILINRGYSSICVKISSHINCPNVNYFLMFLLYKLLLCTVKLTNDICPYVLEWQHKIVSVNLQFYYRESMHPLGCLYVTHEQYK